MIRSHRATGSPSPATRTAPSCPRTSAPCPTGRGSKPHIPAEDYRRGRLENCFHSHRESTAACVSPLFAQAPALGLVRSRVPPATTTPASRPLSPAWARTVVTPGLTVPASVRQVDVVELMCSSWQLRQGDIMLPSITRTDRFDAYLPCRPAPHSSPVTGPPNTMKAHRSPSWCARSACGGARWMRGFEGGHQGHVLDGIRAICASTVAGRGAPRPEP